MMLMISTGVEDRAATTATAKQGFDALLPFLEGLVEIAPRGGFLAPGVVVGISGLIPGHIRSFAERATIVGRHLRRYKLSRRRGRGFPRPVRAPI